MTKIICNTPIYDMPNLKCEFKIYDKVCCYNCPLITSKPHSHRNQVQNTHNAYTSCGLELASLTWNLIIHFQIKDFQFIHVKQHEHKNFHWKIKKRTIYTHPFLQDMTQWHWNFQDRTWDISEVVTDMFDMITFTYKSLTKASWLQLIHLAITNMAK